MTKKQRAVLLTVLITAFITPFMGSSMNLCVINIESEFHTSAAIVGWVITSFTMATVALSIPMGKIADVTGRKRILLMGISGYVILFFLILFSRNIWTKFDITQTYILDGFDLPRITGRFGIHGICNE